MTNGMKLSPRPRWNAGTFSTVNGFLFCGGECDRWLDPVLKTFDTYCFFFYADLAHNTHFKEKKNKYIEILFAF